MAISLDMVFRPASLLLLGIALAVPFAQGATWVISNDVNTPGDYSSIEEALLSEFVLPGDTLEIAPSPISYGHASITKAIIIRGLDDLSGQDLQVSLESLEILPILADGPEKVRLEKLRLFGVQLLSTDVSLVNCRVNQIEATAADNLKITGSWIELFTGSSVELVHSQNVIFTNNLITVNGDGIVFSSDLNSSLSFINNTVIDPSGMSEWVLHKGDCQNNILSVPEGRLAIYNVATDYNISTRRTFSIEENQNNIPSDQLFDDSTDTIERFLPKPAGPAIDTGSDGTDIGMTGGNNPINLGIIPGSGIATEVPPAPSLELLEADIGGFSIEWATHIGVDQFELQFAVDGAPFGSSLFFEHDTLTTSVDSLGEGVEVVIRLRSIRNELASDWVTSSSISTLFAPPPEPQIDTPEAIISGFALSWTSSADVDQFELQFAVDGAPFGSSLFFEHDTLTTSVDGLGEGVEVVIRLRSIRNELASGWVTSSSISTLFAPPPEPQIDTPEAIISGFSLSWSSSADVDQFELQFAVDGAPFGSSIFLDPDISETSVDSLGEGVEVVIRLRSIRNELASGWVTSSSISTLFAPPPEPEIDNFEAIISGFALSWTSSADVDQFELQFAVDGAPFGSSIFLDPDISETSVDSLGEGVEVVIRLRSIRNELASDWVTSSSISTLFSYNPVAHYSAILGNEIEQFDGWMQSAWYGWFSDIDPGIFLHLEHGYQYVLGAPNSVYVYDFGMNLWYWTSQSYYPSLYLYQDPPQWYLFYKGTSSPSRYFYNYNGGDIVHEDDL